MYRILVFVVFNLIALATCDRQFLSLRLRDGERYPFRQPTSRPLSRVQIDTINSTDDLPADWVLWVSYSNSINTTGWAQLEIHSNPDVGDSYQVISA